MYRDKKCKCSKTCFQMNENRGAVAELGLLHRGDTSHSDPSEQATVAGIKKKRRKKHKCFY